MTSKEAIDRYMQKKTLIRKELIDELYSILVGIGMDGIIKRNWDGKLGKIKVADYASTKTPEYRFYLFKEPGVLLKLQSGRIPQTNAEDYILKNFSTYDAPDLNAENSAKDITPKETLTEEDVLELKHRYGDEVEYVVRDMLSGENKRWEDLPTPKENLVEKQVILSGDGYADGELVYDFGECPTCGRQWEDGDTEWEEPYCCHCGQKLHWFDKEAENGKT